MHFQGRFEGPAAPDAVRATLLDPARWGWLDATVVAVAGGCQLQFDGPPRVALRLQLTPTEDGLSLALVEGDLTELDGRVVVAPTETGCVVDVRLDLAFPVAVPGTLLRELDQRLLPTWAASLAQGG